jgi:hypothetical protein
VGLKLMEILKSQFLVKQVADLDLSRLDKNKKEKDKRQNESYKIRLVCH